MPASFEAELLAAVATPGFWRPDEYEAAFAEAGFAELAVEDWSEHAVPSWERVVRALADRRASLERRLGSDLVEATARRFDLWLEAFRRGYLAWTSFRAGRRV